MSRGAFLFAVCLCFLFTLGMVDRPRDPWVFRSVLDRQPRIVTIALHDDLWVAYDATNCTLYKAWTGGVNFEGAVYTTEHGPQPTSFGETYFENDTKDSGVIQLADDDTPPTWRGYTVMDNRVTLHYEIKLNDGSFIKVDETPEYSSEAGTVQLVRQFRTSGVPRGQQLMINDVNNSDDHERNIELHANGETTVIMNLNIDSEPEIEVK